MKVADADKLIPADLKRLRFGIDNYEPKHILSGYGPCGKFNLKLNETDTGILTNYCETWILGDLAQDDDEEDGETFKLPTAQDVTAMLGHLGWETGYGPLDNALAVRIVQWFSAQYAATMPEQTAKQWPKTKKELMRDVESHFKQKAPGPRVPKISGGIIGAMNFGNALAPAVDAIDHSTGGNAATADGTWLPGTPTPSLTAPHDFGVTDGKTVVTNGMHVQTTVCNEDLGSILAASFDKPQVSNSASEDSFAPPEAAGHLPIKTPAPDSPDAATNNQHLPTDVNTSPVTSRLNDIVRTLADRYSSPLASQRLEAVKEARENDDWERENAAWEDFKKALDEAATTAKERVKAAEGRVEELKYHYKKLKETSAR